MLRLYMNPKSSLRRIQHLSNVLSDDLCQLNIVRKNHDGFVQIGKTRIPISTPKVPQYVPYAYVKDSKQLPQTVLRHLRWIAQKDLLGQDVFLIGPPGPLRRILAMQYLELTRKEFEYIALSRDTTENDLKQRREMSSGTSFYVDQCAVKAAIEGRVLVMEGIEKAERNVLPALNNLLENREMQLDDGRFLMHPKRYDQLLQEHSKEKLDEWKLVRVNENFRVFALGLPVPKYRGNPLDPPLRSRFQARDIYHLSFSDQLQALYQEAPSIDTRIIANILSCATTLVTQDSANIGIPDFPLDNLTSAMSILEKVPSYPLSQLLSHLYPYHLLLNKEGFSSVEGVYKKFDISPSYKSLSLRLLNVNPTSNDFVSDVEISADNCSHKLQVKSGNHQKKEDCKDLFVSTEYHQQLLTDLILSHSSKDFCIIGGKGCGKTSVVRQFAKILNYRSEPLLMYQDMTSRDLLQQRFTLPNGDTTWKPSPLIQAAVDGGLAVLDGLNRVNAGTLSILQRLVHDREVTLHDGTRLLHHEKYDEIKEQMKISDEEMNNKSVYRIHPSFRMIALAEPPKVASTQQWLSPELLTMFLYHHMTPLNTNQELELISSLVPSLHQPIIKDLLSVTEHLRSNPDTTSQSLASSLSTRQLVRIARRLDTFSNASTYKQLISDAVHKACLSRFLPSLTRIHLTEALQSNGLPPEPTDTKNLTLKDISCKVSDGYLTIDDVTHLVYGSDDATATNTSSAAKVPDVLFYDNAQHLVVMKEMLQDYSLGEHLLLVGNQGVGKNKVVDRFLQLLNKPREYLQLHRDTTVQSLTVQPTVRDGIVVYEDSALVKAVKLGHALVVDEADKAPTHVTCVLKALLENGRANLADGRKIVTDPMELDNLSKITTDDEIILMHPNFRMLVLANRPGFPFLGNDFFSSLGDVFSCHAVDNPSVQSELNMLRQYGPSVPDQTLKKLVGAFGELREMADRGLISYPYSTREVVNIVKHLEKFGNEGVAAVVGNVFDFDAYNKETQEQLSGVMHKHGIPVGAKPQNIHLSKALPITKAKLTDRWSYGESRGFKLERIHSSVKGPIFLDAQNYEIERIRHRGFDFTEQVAHWNIPQFYQSTIISHMSTSTDAEQVLYVATVSPHALYRHVIDSDQVIMVDLYDAFPSSNPMTQAHLKVVPMCGSLSGQVVIYDEKLKTLLLVDSTSGETRRIHLPIIDERRNAMRKIVNRFMNETEEPVGTIRMCTSMPSDNCIVFYHQEGNKIIHLNVLDGCAYCIHLPILIENLQLLSTNKWMVTEYAGNKSLYLLEESDDSFLPSKITLIKSEKDEAENKLEVVSRSDLSTKTLSKVLQESIDAPNRLLADSKSFAKCVVGLPLLKSPNEVYTFERNHHQLPLQTPFTDFDLGKMYYRGTNKMRSADPVTQILPNACQVLRVVPSSYVPEKSFEEEILGSSDYFLEVADVSNHVVKYVSLPSPLTSSPYVSWQSGISESGYLMTCSSDERIFTSDSGGCIREWETGLSDLQRSLRDWQAMIGSTDDRDHLQITSERASGLDVTAPKHGKEDPDNTPHVGGNTWAGGTGGRDTAGLGGKGGPYRLDAGHDVTQIPDWEKEAVPDHVKKAAREMGLKAFKERLQEIRMSEYDAKMYEQLSGGVRKQVSTLRVLLDSLQAKNKERQWVKHQTTGELDDMKLIEGLTGEKNIYKKRMEEEPEPGQPQQKPKLLRVVVDVSGSMYRFNGLDQRLERCMESACLVMEAFEGYKDKFQYEIWGHSGDGFDIEFVQFSHPPENNKQRLKVLKEMHAHSQFCMSGDHTLEATRFAIKDIKQYEADEHFVIVLSDANLQRYGIQPSSFADALRSDEEVKSFAIFIGSLGDQAEKLKRSLPSGKSFVCLDTKDIPQIMQQIFTSTIIH